MSSMAWPFSSFFSISIMSLTPSTTICTCSTSEKPSRSALETSNTAPTASVSTPPGGEPRGVGSEGQEVPGGEGPSPVTDNTSGPGSGAQPAPTWVVYPGLDDVIQGEAAGGLLVPQLLVDVQGEGLGHVVIVLGEVRKLLLRGEVQLVLVVGVPKRHDGGRGRVLRGQAPAESRGQPLAGAKGCWAKPLGHAQGADPTSLPCPFPHPPGPNSTAATGGGEPHPRQRGKSHRCPGILC
uniref:Uncharacterized protein n=1 Tax=Chelonoidis abingdonii TaxID=106734 RepID=A0A8C0GKS3_CHEAB